MNESEEGISLSEEGLGNLISHFVKVTTNENGKEGIDVEESGDGNLKIGILHSESSSNGDDGIELTELGVGRFIGITNKITANSNAGLGLDLTQEIGIAADWGRLKLGSSDLSGNTDGEFETDGVTVK